jgi:hypothetical protein
MSADAKTLIAGQWMSTKGSWIYISTNSGASWSTNRMVNIQNSLDVLALANGKRLYVMISPYFFTTTNAGLSWTTNYLPASPYSWISLAGSADGSILAAMGFSNVNSGASSIGAYVCVSTNGGTSWILGTLNPTAYWQSGWIAMSADGSKLIAPTYGAIFISTNLGASWSQSIAANTNWWVAATSADGNKLAVTVLGNTTYTKATGGIWTSQTTPSPQLNLVPSPTNRTLAWTVPSTNFVMQQSSDLQNWADMTNQPVLNLTNLQDEVILPPSGSNVFYRLKTP